MKLHRLCVTIITDRFARSEDDPKRVLVEMWGDPEPVGDGTWRSAQSLRTQSRCQPTQDAILSLIASGLSEFEKQ